MPNWVLKEDWTVYVGTHDPITIKKDTFINPINKSYVPKEVKERYPGINHKLEIFCNTKYGIFPLPRKIIEEWEARF